MAGIYLHIPFCRQACHYCDFHFSTSLSLKEKVINALCIELAIQQKFLPANSINTIYFGGGTPSLLTAIEISEILDTISKNYHIKSDVEITMEANPDDLSKNKLREIKALGINRLSIGVQSFHEPHLKYLNRVHSSAEARNCISFAKQAGFDNISIDLIYGIPHTDHSIWIDDIQKAIEFDVDHISTYCLTIEEKTVFGNWLKRGIINEVEDEYAAEQFEIMMESFLEADYEQYEISNFCRGKKYSKHNTSYWQQIPYLGIGPGAHSYNKEWRQYNISNNALYVKSINEGVVPYEKDELSTKENINEYILISLRTIWGIDITHLKKQMNYDLLDAKSKYIHQLINEGLALLAMQKLTLTTKGKLLADTISFELFVD